MAAKRRVCSAAARRKVHTGGAAPKAAVALAVAAALLSILSAVAAAFDVSALEEPTWVPVGPGVHHAVVTASADGSRHHINVLRVERENPHVSLAAVLGRGQVEGTETVRAQALRLTTAPAAPAPFGGSSTGALSDSLNELLSRLGTHTTFAGEPRVVVGGVNADFFASAPTPGLPIGLHVQGGELVVGPNGRPAFAVLADGRVVIGVPQMMGAVWREEPPGTPAGEGGLLEGMNELLVRASITHVNRPLNGLGLVLYTPRFGPETPFLEGTVVTVRGIVGPLVSGRTYTGVVAKVETGRGSSALRASIPEDGVVLAARGPAEVLLEDLRVGEWVQFQVDLAPPFDEAVEAVGGWPVLIRDGVAIPATGGDSLVTGRHPRTAVGFNDDYIYLVTVDGRQAEWSDGMTLAELTQLLLALGATDALNLDGGGSTTMVVRPPGETELAVVNAPSDGHERVVANALFVVSTAPSAPLATLLVRPAAPAALAGAAVPLQLLGQDRYYNPVDVEPAGVAWTVSGDAQVALQWSGTEAAPVLVTGDAGVVAVAARVGGVNGTATVDVVDSVDRIELVPDIVHLAAGESATLKVRAYDENGRIVWVEPRQLTWTAAPEAGLLGAGSDGIGDAPVQVDGEGVVFGVGRGAAVVRAQLGDAVGAASVTVDRAPVLLSDFETEGVWFANAVRAQAALSLVEPPEPVYAGQRAAKLAYDLSVSPGGTAAAYVQAATPIPIPDRPRAIGVWVYGDASGHWLRANYIDGDGRRQVLDLTRVGGLNWTGWRFVQAEIPEDAVLPLAFERVYVVEMHRERQSRGVLYFDDLVAIYGQR